MRLTDLYPRCHRRYASLAVVVAADRLRRQCAGGLPTPCTPAVTLSRRLPTRLRTGRNTQTYDCDRSVPGLVER
jgi:hypothetical protein